jgi:hypothetical protein
MGTIKTARAQWCHAAVAMSCLAFAAPVHADDERPSGISAASSSATLLTVGRLVPGQVAGDVQAPNRFANIRFEAHFAFGWYGALGGGGRVEFPIVRAGLLQNVDDELALSIGAEIFYFYGPSLGLGVTPLAALQWNFFVGNSVSLFPELGLAFIFGPSRDQYWATFIAPYLGLGVRFHFTDRNAVLLRVSWPAGLQVGLTF